MKIFFNNPNFFVLLRLEKSRNVFDVGKNGKNSDWCGRRVILALWMNREAEESFRKWLSRKQIREMRKMAFWMI